jgi:hypothetical protein
MLTQENVNHLKPENYVHLLLEQQMTVESIKEKIEQFTLDQEDRKKAFQQVDFAIARINQSLTLEEFVTFFFFPFGIVTSLIGNSLFDVDEQRRMGYVHRVKQFNYISIIGVVVYMLVGMFIAFIF